MTGAVQKVICRPRSISDRVAQLRWVAKERMTPFEIRLRWEVRCSLQMEGARWPRRRVDGSVWAVTMVRDEIDILPSVLDHLLAQGVDGIIVVDNLSQDGTWEYLQQRARGDARLHVGRDVMFAYHQGRKMTALASLASRAGADWVIPFDADEFWFASRGSVAEWLRSRDSDVVRADWYDMVYVGQGQINSSSAFLLDTTPSDLPKVVFRTIPGAELGIGNHTVRRVGQIDPEVMSIAHARWRSREQVARKVRQGAAAMSAAGTRGYGSHWTSAARLTDDEIDEVWARMRRGKSVALLDWKAVGPMREVRPLGWTSWDSAGQILRPRD